MNKRTGKAIERDTCGGGTDALNASRCLSGGTAAPNPICAARGSKGLLRDVPKRLRSEWGQAPTGGSERLSPARSVGCFSRSRAEPPAVLRGCEGWPTLVPHPLGPRSAAPPPASRRARLDGAAAGGRVPKRVRSEWGQAPTPPKNCGRLEGSRREEHAEPRARRDASGGRIEGAKVLQSGCEASGGKPPHLRRALRAARRGSHQEAPDPRCGARDSTGSRWG